MFNEELSFRSHVPCCHCSSCLSVYFERNWTTHNGGFGGRRSRVAGQNHTRPQIACDPNRNRMLGAAPPPGAHFGWRPWQPGAYNELPLTLRRLGRCTGYRHKCLAWERREKEAGRLVVPPKPAPGRGKQRQ